MIESTLNGELANNREWEIMYGEWYTEDESIGDKNRRC